MKNQTTIKTTLFLLCLGMWSFTLQAQITITSSDMPSANDTFRLSETLPLQGQFTYDLTQSGPNHIWDFTNLTPDASTVDTFFSPLSTPITYNFVFTNPFLYPDNFASLAQRSQTLPQTPGGGVGGSGTGITFSDAYDFIANNSTEYAIVGNAFKLNEVPSPNAFDGNDVVYEFPLNFQDQFSSNSKYEIQIDGLVAYYHRQTRTNVVDGWGMVYTPYGGFEAIRIKSTIVSTDSIILDAIPFPITLPQTNIEYKWLAKTIGVPVLQINAQSGGGGMGGGGNQTLISSIHYLDSLPHGNYQYTEVDTSKTDSTASISEQIQIAFEIYPNPTENETFLSLPIITQTNREAIIRDISGKEIFRIELETLTTKINLSTIVQGVYLIEIGCSRKKLIKM
jgi:hypothetical protein